jgi:UDP-glucose:(heptosyl)LPS alpha-1,3-glucosyltransferase
VIERFVPAGGGVENVAWQVAHGLARAGEDVTVVSREIGDPEASTGPPHPAVQHVFAPRFWQPLRVLAFSRSAGRRVHGERPRFDVVHSFSRTRHQDLYRAGGGSHADYLERMHPGVAGRLRGLSPRHRALLSIERRVFEDLHQRIQCASRLVARCLSERHGVDPERIVLLPNGVDLARYASASAHAAGRSLRSRENEGGAPVWLFPGSGWRRKGLDRVFRALSRLLPMAPHVWVAGRDAPAPWRRRAARLGIADRIRFLGPRRDLETLYHAVDGMLLPTRYDPFANVTLEAAAAGLAIVTTRANGAAEWLGDACRILEDDDDPSQLARALAGLGDPTARAALGARAARRAQDFGWPAHVEALRDEYRRIVEARRGAGTGR